MEDPTRRDEVRLTLTTPPPWEPVAPRTRITLDVDMSSRRAKSAWGSGWWFEAEERTSDGWLEDGLVDLQLTSAGHAAPAVSKPTLAWKPTTTKQAELMLSR